MGLGAYLAAVTDRELYLSEERRETAEVLHKPEAEKAQIYEIFEEYGVARSECVTVVQALERNPDNWVKVRIEMLACLDVVQNRLMRCQFMMAFELKLVKPNIYRAWISAATMGASYFIGMFQTSTPRKERYTDY